MKIRGMKNSAVAGLAFCALALGGCESLGLNGLMGGSVTLSQSTAAAYDSYLAQLGEDKHGIFAITADGAGYGFTMCGATPCDNIGQEEALRGCRIGNPEAECQVFAIDRDTRMSYDVAE